MRQAGTRRALLLLAWGLVAAVAIVPPPGSALAVTSPREAPGAPGAKSDWVPGDKDGFGTARGTSSKVWYTLHRGLLSEIYYPRLDTPSTRATQLVVTDGRTFTDRESDDTTHRVRLRDPRSLTYEQVNRARSGKYSITKTYTADPARSTVLVDIRFRSLTRRPYRVYVLHDPALSMTGDDDTGATAGGMLVATDGTTSGAVAASGGFTATSSGYAGVSDGWRDLAGDHRMDWSYAARRPGNVVQLGETTLTGVGCAQRLTLAVAFGSTTSAASAGARASLATRFGPVQEAYAGGWHAYLAGLKPVPKAARRWATEYHVSRVVLAASEDKTYRGGFVAAPARPWAWANASQRFPVYHAVWSRDLYQIATALLAVGDRAAADRALTYLFRVQQRPDGSYPQNSRLSGQPVFGGLQLDEVSLPTVLAGHLGRTGRRDWPHIRRAEDFVVTHGPRTEQERWENLGGYSPATIAAEIAGLVVGADVARKNGAPAVANRYLATADTWRRNLGRWTVTTTGPYGAGPYFLRITDGNANAGTPVQIADGGPRVDQRRILDPSFLEVVRLGVVRPDDARVRNTVRLVDTHLGYTTANGPFWHRASFDGYGERRTGSQWENVPPGSRLTVGRGWPLLTGERGEYDLAAGLRAQSLLDTVARAADDDTWLLPEQVWDDQAPSSGRGPAFRPGEPTTSATPLAWTHAEFLRLAWSIDAGRPTDTPRPVACRYHSPLCLP